MIEFISATRLSERDFWSISPLGLSLGRLREDARLVPHIAFVNQRGLPEVFNARIAAPTGGEYLVFIHDDVWIDDHFVGDRIVEGLREFDVIGVAGNRRRLPAQPAWFAVDLSGKWDDEASLSGRGAHGAQPSGAVTYYGKVPASCELLDGVFIAAKKSVLTEYGILFDSRFDFHFYDLDFCRAARECGIRLGTWPISLTHRSNGQFASPMWLQRYRQYIDKWGS